MPALAIRLAVDEDLRAFTSQTSEGLLNLPTLYIPTDDPQVMRSWGIARADGDGSVAVYERLYPGSLVAPRYVGQWADRADLMYHGAELAADHVAAPQSKPGSTAFE
jgi:hypothetical protein